MGAFTLPRVITAKVGGVRSMGLLALVLESRKLFEAGCSNPFLNDHCWPVTVINTPEPERLLLGNVDLV